MNFEVLIDAAAALLMVGLIVLNVSNNRLEPVKIRSKNKKVQRTEQRR